jgi:hypothetical protein
MTTGLFNLNFLSRGEGNRQPGPCLDSAITCDRFP